MSERLAPSLVHRNRSVALVREVAFWVLVVGAALSYRLLFGP